MAEQVFFPIQLITKQIIARDIVELRFTKPVDFTFVPGQFVQFQISDGDKYVLRSYSISSLPSDVHLEFCVKILPDGKASQFFDQIVFGNTAFISTAKGRFICDTIGPNYFIATGTGLAPVMSMVQHLAVTTALPGAHHVLFGVRHEADLFWLDRFLELQKKSIASAITLSQPATTWTGLKGRVTEHVVPDTTGHYYICGSLDMVKDIRAKLSAAGVGAKNIHFEIF